MQGQTRPTTKCLNCKHAFAEHSPGNGDCPVLGGVFRKCGSKRPAQSFSAAEISMLSEILECVDGNRSIAHYARALNGRRETLLRLERKVAKMKARAEAVHG